MSNNIKLYGFINTGVQGEGGYEFEFGDIYIKQANKWLKENSADFSKLVNSMDVLKAGKGFAFYTKSEDGSRYTSLGMRFLKDFLKNRSTPQSSFTLKIVAITGSNSLIVNCSDCELMQSMMMTTPIGTLQSYEFKFKTASVEKMAATSRK